MNTTVNINTVEQVSSQLQEYERLREVSIGLRYGTNEYFLERKCKRIYEKHAGADMNEDILLVKQKIFFKFWTTKFGSELDQKI